MHATTAILLGLVAALLPWLPSCPARISAADLPPPPPRGLNVTGEAQPQDSPLNTSGGASSNSVQEARKPEVRIPATLSDPPVAGEDNCTAFDGCGSRARNASAPEATSLPVEERGQESRSEDAPEAPLPVRIDRTSERRPEEVVNRLEAPGYADDSPSKNLLRSRSGSNKTLSTPGLDPSSVAAPSEAPSSDPTLSSTRSGGRSIGGGSNEANHVFSSAGEDAVDSFDARISGKEGERGETAGERAREEGGEFSPDAPEEDDYPGEEEEESPEGGREHTTSDDELSYHYKEFSRAEYAEKNDPEVTRSYAVVENGTHVHFSSSNVVSEVYDSESPDEETATSPPSAASANRTAPSLGGSEGKAGDEESHEEEDEEHLEREAHGAVPPDVERNAGDAEADAVESSLVHALAPLAAESLSTDAPTAEPPEDKSGLLTSPPITSLRASSAASVDGDPSTSVTEATNSVPETEGAREMSSLATTMLSTTTTEISTTQSTTATNISTTQSTTRTSVRSPHPSPSTTESPIKNEVTYNDNATGLIYDLKANISARATSTPMLSMQTQRIGTITKTSSYPSNSSVINHSETSSSVEPLAGIESPETTSMPEQNGTVASVTMETDSKIEDVNSTISWENTYQDTTLLTVSGEMGQSTTMPPTEAAPSTLFTIVQPTRMTDLLFESMSSTMEDGFSFTETNKSTTRMYINDTSVEATTSSPQNYPSIDKSDTIVTTTAIPDLRTFSNNSDIVTVPEMSTVAAETELTLSPVMSSSLGPEKEEETKVSLMTLVHSSEVEGSDRPSDIIADQTVTVQPLSTAMERHGTTSSEDVTSSPLVTLKEVTESSTKSTSSPPTVQIHSINEKIETNVNETEVAIRAYPAYVRLWMKISWNEICREELQMSLKEAVSQLLSKSTHRTIPISRVVLLNLDESCPRSAHGDAKSLSPVHLCILATAEKEQSERRDGSREDKLIVHCDSVLTELFRHIWTQAPQPMLEPLKHVKEVDLVKSRWSVEDGLEFPLNPPDDNTSIFAAIGISCVAAVCLLLIGALLILMRRRQRRFNYGQRCTPVSLDAYSLDSVSVREGSRHGRAQPRNGDAGRGVNGLRKGDGLNDWRASKRSYGNPAFEDDEGEEVLLSKPVNFAALANAAINEDGALADEFALIPKRFHKRTLRRKSRSRRKDPGVAAERGEGGMKDDNEEDEDLPEGAEEKNRYANVVPIPSTRVLLSPKPYGPLSTYINANYVRGPKNKEKFYIACQAPLASTVEDFWRMIWEQQSKVILMLTSLVENGVEKCADYLPPSEVLDCHRLFGDYQVTLKKREVREKYVVSSLQLKDMESNLWREVTHLWFLGWPVTGVPDEASQIIAFLIEARPFMQANTGPTVVHCSPGTGRTGAMIAIDVCIRDFEQSRMVDVPRVVQQLRRDRDGAVQTQQQYAFIYQALSLYATKLTGGAMDSF